MTVHNPAQNSSDNLELFVTLHNIIAAQTWNKKQVTVACDSYTKLLLHPRILYNDDDDDDVVR